MAALAVAIATAALPASSVARGAHPIHTTLTEVTVDPTRHAVRAVVRVFSDDLAHAIGHRGNGPAAPSEAQTLAYVGNAVRLSDHGAPVALHSCGVRTSGDLLWVCLEGAALADGRGLALRDAMLCELFSDQVNIVQIAANGSKKSVLFTRGDGPKPLL